MTSDRDYVYIRNRPITHAVASRDWVCGRCESALITVFEDGWHTVCAADRSHPSDGFIHRGSLERRVHEEMVQAGNLGLAERRKRMGLRDRDTPYGTPQRMRLGRIGRVRQGIKVTNSQGKTYPKAVEYFILDPSSDDGQEREQILADVRTAMAEHAPPQDLDRPTVLPILFLAGNDEIIAPESYKLRRGRAGTIWCAGDGDTIHWKLSDDFRVEIAQGTDLNGQPVPCPGGRQEGRHEWCEQCIAELEINFAIAGYERTGIWMLRTQSMIFRDQFWTQIGMVRALAERSIIPGLVGVPFLLRRHMESVLSPVGKDGALASVEMPITSIEIHPDWFQQIMRRNPRLTGRPVEALPEPDPTGPDWDRYAAAGEVIDGDPELTPPPPPETSPTADSAPAPGSQTGHEPPVQNGRPLTAVQIRSILRYRAGWKIGQAADYGDASRVLDGEPISEKQVGAMANLLSKAVKEKGMTQQMLNKARYDILGYLFSVRSTKDLMLKEASAIIKWLALDEKQIGEINGYARAEAAAILKAMAVDAGQQALPLPEAEGEAEEDLPF